MTEAYWVELDELRYPEMYDIFFGLKRAHSAGKIQDTLISTTHPLEINFGFKPHRNTFTDSFLQEVKRRRGDSSFETALNVLKEMNVPFSKVNREGGATVVGPGQAPFYIAADWKRVRVPRIGKDGAPVHMDTSVWRALIDDVMCGVVSYYSVPELHTATNYHKKEEDRDLERKDIWTVLNGKPYKLGARIGRVDEHAAVGGFVFYLTDNGVRYTDIVHNCGIPLEEAGVTSIAAVGSRAPTLPEIKDYTKLEVARVFQYERFDVLKQDEFLEIVRPHIEARTLLKQ